MLMTFTVPPTLLDPNSPVQLTIELVEKLSMDAIRGWDGPKTKEGLVRVHEVLHWRLDGYTAELCSVLEGFQLAKRRLAEHIEIMEAKGVAIPVSDDEFEEDFGVSEGEP